MYRKKIGMLVAEWLGAAVLTFVVLSVSQSAVGLPYFTGAAAGLTLGTLVMILGRVSGAFVNPAITIGLWTVRKLATLQAIAFVAAEVLGGLTAWRLFEYLTGRAVANIAGKNFDWKVLIAEMIGTAIFGMGVAAVVYQGYAGLRASTTIGTALFIGILIASVASNAILNPAVAVGIRSLSRAYLAGPVIGSVVGMNLYAYLFAEKQPRSEVKTTIKPLRAKKKENK